MAVSKRLRYEILRRDNHRCRYCGATAPDVPLRVDHVLPVALGGGDDPSNLVAACQDCNAGKAASTPDAALVADVSEDAIRWARAAAEASRLMAIETMDKWDFAREIGGLWESCTIRWDGTFWPRPEDWPDGLDGFRRRGLSRVTIVDSLRIAIAANHVAEDDRWRYFCGICWKKISQLEEAARAILAADDGGA